ncbi:MAG: 5-methyltetrahydropteroyltriglutamate--homocysteine S-methyltransferase [Burkholderiales bacterium]
MPFHPPFRAEVVGSLLRPAAIHQSRADLAQGKISAAELRDTESRCVRDAVAMQKSVGLNVCTDGEFHRRHWFMDFIERIDGVTISGTMGGKFQNATGDADWSPPRIEVNGKLGRSRDLAVQDFRDLAPVARDAGLLAKQPIPSPTILHFRGGRAAISKSHYPDIEAFYADLAEVYRQELRALYEAGCRYAQIDETNLAFLCDPKIRAQVVALGENPDTLPATYAKLLNDVLRDKPVDFVIGMHLCRGNHASSWMAEGAYDPVAEVIFGGINVDALFVEYDSPRAGGFAPLRYLGKNRVAVLGLVTTKTAQLESKDDLKRRIDEAAKYAPLEQLALSPQCGFASTILGNKLTEDDQRRKLDLVTQTAREVWGTS